jgi:hypothetical protein
MSRAHVWLGLRSLRPYEIYLEKSKGLEVQVPSHQSRWLEQCNIYVLVGYYVVLSGGMGGSEGSADVLVADSWATRWRTWAVC